jgi:hypothetical protein
MQSARRWTTGALCILQTRDEMKQHFAGIFEDSNPTPTAEPQGVLGPWGGNVAATLANPQFTPLAKQLALLLL